LSGLGIVLSAPIIVCKNYREPPSTLCSLGYPQTWSPLWRTIGFRFRHFHQAFDRSAGSPLSTHSISTLAPWKQREGFLRHHHHHLNQRSYLWRLTGYRYRHSHRSCIRFPHLDIKSALETSRRVRNNNSLLVVLED